MQAKCNEEQASQDGQHPLVNVRRELPSPYHSSPCADGMPQDAAQRDANHVC